MRKIKLFIASSIDGYIARNDGDLDWLTEFPNPEKTDYSYKSFYESVDTVLMGGRTYFTLRSMDVLFPYKDKTTYIITRNPFDTKENIRFITENIIEEIKQLKQEEGKDIFLAGGGELTAMLLNAGLIDELIITRIPLILGSGTALFPKPIKESQWKLINNTAYSNGVVQTAYEKI